MINVAVLGAGHWGPNLIRTFHNKETSVVRWVVDRAPGRLSQAKQRVPEVNLAESPEAAFTDPAVEAVVIATPTSTHFALAKAALEHGKHVLIEKPIAGNAADGIALSKLAAERERVLMVGHIFLFNSGVLKVKEYLDEGRLGRTQYMSMMRTNLGPIRTDVNAAWDLASHDISIANYWLGGNARAVSAYGGSWINPSVQDAVFATLRYDDGVLVNLQASWLNPRKNRDITVVGDKRMLTFDDMSLGEPIRIYDKTVADDRASSFEDGFASFRSQVRDGDVLIPKVSVVEPLKAECNHFLSCVRDGSAARTGAAMAVDVVRVLEAIDRSMQRGGQEEAVER